MRRLGYLLAVSISFMSAQPLSSEAAGTILQRSRQALNDAFASGKYVDNILLSSLLYQHRNDTAL
jgi:hypothetical protein